MAPPPPPRPIPPPRRASERKPTLKRSSSVENLFNAIGEGNVNDVMAVLHSTKDPIGLMQKKDLQGLTPLRKAMALGQSEIAQRLVTEGADAGQRGALDKVALHDAALVGQRLLLAPLLSSPNVAVNVQDKFGMTPLHNAVRMRHLKAVEWLLFAGADVNIVNDRDESPLDLINLESENEKDQQIYKLLESHNESFDELDLSICCGYVRRKQISKLGGDVSLTFVTTDLWPVEPQFVFCIKINPLQADPQIPLRNDERFFCHVYKYRLMYPLPKGQRRVKLYFTILEEFLFSKLILKVCSKTQVLGEVPINITSYPYQKYINFLGSCEIALQNEGQFALIKRPVCIRLVPDQDGILGYPLVPLFKLGATKLNFPAAPPNWNQNRRLREWEECQRMVAALPRTETDVQKINHNSNATESKKQRPSVAFSSYETAEDSEQEEVEEEPVQLLDWTEPDTCDDFYYISYGWACHLSYRRTVQPSVVMHKFAAEVEEPIVRAVTNFFRLTHPSNTMTGHCMCQIPKTPEFEKIGTTLVFQRQDLDPYEKEDPNPDDTVEEFFMSEDGRHTNGQAWMLKEMKRWSLINSGIVSKPTRIIFTTEKLGTFVGVQLKIGEEKWDMEDESDSDESDGEEEEGAVAAEGEEGEEIKKKKKKKKKKAETEGGEDEEGNNEEDQNENRNITNNHKPVGFDHLTVLAGRNASIGGTVDDEETIYAGLEPLEEEFAMGLDELAKETELDRDDSSEILGPPLKQRSLSISFGNKKEDGFDAFQFGPPRDESEFEEEQYTGLLKEIALMWRCRNHRQAKVLAFTRNRSGPLFDLVLELVQESDLVVRAECRWIEGYNMVAASPLFLTLTGRLYTFSLEGTMAIESPASGSLYRPMYYYSICVNELHYVVKRIVVDEYSQPGKKHKKKEEPTAESNEIDAILQVSSFPQGTWTDGTDLFSMGIPLTGPNVWRQQHLTLREPDKGLLEPIVIQLSGDNVFADNWWKIWILMGFDEKQMEAEKTRQDWADISKTMLWRWFEENIDCRDRGITSLINILNALHLDVPIFRLMGELKKYKMKIQNELNQPRQLDTLFHWVMGTKMTSASFRRKGVDPPALSPLSDHFLMHLNELLSPNIFPEMGPLMDLEDNLLNSISGEENIVDPKYKTFKALVKSKQKKDEVVGFTLLLSQMVLRLGQHEAVDYVVRETRRWMATVIRAHPDTCTKLENVLQTIAKD